MRKTNLVTFRVEEQEHEALKNQADEIGLTLSEYIRKQMQNEPIIKIYQPKELLQQINGIGNNINQIAKHSNSFGSVSNYEIQRLKYDVANLKRQIYQFVGSADVICQ